MLPLHHLLLTPISLIIALSFTDPCSILIATGRAAQYRPDVIAKKKGKKSRRRGDDDDDDELESEEEESADEGPETAGTVASSSVVASSSAAHAQAGSGAAQPALAPFVINGEQKQAWPQVGRRWLLSV